MDCVNILDYFSPPTFRAGQQDAIEAVAAAFKAGARFVILECPTGTGKSHIGATFSRAFEKAHIITPQKILQDQYAGDFGMEMFIMKGRGAYRCLIDAKSGESRSCAEGRCRSVKGPVCDDCPYRNALRAAKAASITVHNFDSFYYQSMVGAFGKRPLLLIDEAHNIEGKFLNFIELKISNKKDRALTIPDYARIEQYDEFLKAYKKKIEARLTLIEELAELTREEFKEGDELKDQLRRIDTYFSTSKKCEYVFEYADDRMHQSVTFKPLFVGNFVNARLFQQGDYVLMMSATFLDKELFCKSIGIDPSKAAYISLPSYFPVEHRLIVKDYVGPMSFKHITNTLPKIVEKLKEILADHVGERGIVHTVSERIASYIQRNLFDSRLTFRRDYKTVNEMLIAHEEKPDSFIVASGLREGLDLRGDLSRVQVIAKVPYLSLGDKRVKRRMELSRDWYGYATALLFIQSIGRSVRSVEDTAVTYVLDKDFSRFYGMYKKFIPEYIQEAIIDVYDYYDMLGVEIA